MAEDIGLKSVAQAASYLGIAEITLRRKIRGRTIPFHKIGDRYLFTSRDLESFLESVRVPSVEDQQTAAGAARRRLRAAVGETGGQK